MEVGWLCHAWEAIQLELQRKSLPHFVDFKGFYSHYQIYKKPCKAVLTLTTFFSYANRFGLFPCRIRHYVESMQMLCHRVCKTYANVSYIAFTRSYVVSMPGLIFLYKKCYFSASQTEPT